jgi:hypothetical protein
MSTNIKSCDFCLRQVSDAEKAVMITFESLTINVRIARDWRDVYDFVSAPENFPHWASGLGKSLERVDGQWIAQGPGGPVAVRFTERNDFGIVDHTVILSPGDEITVPMRVIANHTGCEVMLTLFRLPGMTDTAFAADADWVKRDLNMLKAVLEA